MNSYGGGIAFARESDTDIHITLLVSYLFLLSYGN